MTASQPSNAHELLTRLTSVAGEQDGSRKRTFSRPPVETFESREPTPPPITAAEAEGSSYRELIENGGRPVCSIEDLLYLLTNPTAGYDTLSPWLSDHADAKIGEGEIKTVFSRQFARWWDFRKSQWDNRGKSDGDEGFAAFLQACRSRYDRMGAHQTTSGSSFEATIRRQWQHKPAGRQFRVPDSQAFPPYRDAVKRRLARHNFARPLQLRKDPRRQTKWTNWLEYVGYEQWRLEEQTAIAESLGEQTRLAWIKLLRARSSFSQRTKDSYDTDANATSRSAASGSSHTRLRTKTVNLGKELETARAELHAANKILDDFIRETAPYRQASTAAYHQRLRVDWAVKEARLMEIEMSQQCKTAKSGTRADVEENRKRRRADDGEEKDGDSEPWSKRTRHGGGAKITVSDSTQGKSRRSQRLAQCPRSN